MLLAMSARPGESDTDCGLVGEKEGAPPVKCNSVRRGIFFYFLFFPTLLFNVTCQLFGLSDKAN